MISCPFCSHQNIEGAEECEACEQSLAHEYLPEPVSAVERDLIKDHIPILKPKPPIVVSPDASVLGVLKLLVEKKVGCVLVARKGAVAGIFSERDALRRVGSEVRRLGHRPVSEFMTPRVESLDESAKIAFAVQRMDVGHYRHIPIVDAEGRPTGVISVRDILRYLTERSA